MFESPNEVARYENPSTREREKKSQGVLVTTLMDGGNYPVILIGCH